MIWIEDNQNILRLSLFLGTLLLMLAWERKSPTRDSALFFSTARDQLKRRASNIGLTVLNALLIKLLPAVTATSAAIWASSNSIGLFNSLELSSALTIAATILLLDLGIYWQHRLMHSSPILWRLHKVHHCDPDFDTTTALRFHPVEILISMLYKAILVILLGAPVYAVVLFEALLNASALFNHGNVSIPKSMEKTIRQVLVTPDMHRIHHSTDQLETDSNYGFFISIWDRWFKTYKNNSQRPQNEMPIGLDEYQSEKMKSLIELLWLPIKPQTKK